MQAINVRLHTCNWYIGQSDHAVLSTLTYACVPQGTL